jgi:hypothetical protein
MTSGAIQNYTRDHGVSMYVCDQVSLFVGLVIDMHVCIHKPVHHSHMHLPVYQQMCCAYPVGETTVLQRQNPLYTSTHTYMLAYSH